MSTPKKITEAREAWIAHYAGYFGEPTRLPDYRSGQISFAELYFNAIRMAEDMVTEARRIPSFAKENES